MVTLWRKIWGWRLINIGQWVSLMEEDGRHWDLTKLMDCFSQKDFVDTFKPERDKRQADLGWWEEWCAHGKIGVLHVPEIQGVDAGQSGRGLLAEDLETTDPTESWRLCGELWEIFCPPNTLKWKGIEVNLACNHCVGEEDLDYVLMKCDLARDVWRIWDNIYEIPYLLFVISFSRYWMGGLLQGRRNSTCWHGRSGVAERITMEWHGIPATTDQIPSVGVPERMT